jgi:hypothetical protein
MNINACRASRSNEQKFLSKPFVASSSRAEKPGAPSRRIFNASSFAEARNALIVPVPNVQSQPNLFEADSFRSK